MPEERTVLDHLLEGRDALQREVTRLSAAIAELDAVLGRIGSTVARSAAPDMSGPADSTVSGSISDLAETTRTLTVPRPAAAEPVNAADGFETASSDTVQSRPRAVRKTPAKKASRARRTGNSEPPKSIRVHVLEMLQAENRDFGLAEIIDRVHNAGIQAHDDAVRSITIKLMKDGRVERVGRGQYRLARRGSATRASAAVATAPRVTEFAPEPRSVVSEPVASTATQHTTTDQAATTANAASEASTHPSYAPTEAPASESSTSGIDVRTGTDAGSDLAARDGAETAVIEPGPNVDNAVEPGPADPGFAAPAADFGASDLGASESGASESGASESSASESGASESGASELGASELGDAELTDTESSGGRHHQGSPEDSAQPVDGAASVDRSYAPSLNLGQPWHN